MMLLLAIDPGVETGCCLFHDGTPMSCFTLHRVSPDTVWDELLLSGGVTPCPVSQRSVWDEVTPSSPGFFLELSGNRLRDVVIEVPDEWTRRGTNVKSILAVSNLAYTLFGHFQHVGVDCRMIPVSMWKAMKPKRRTEDELRLIEKAEPITITSMATNSHERDALALGVWWWTRRKIEKER